MASALLVGEQYAQGDVLAQSQLTLDRDDHVAQGEGRVAGSFYFGGRSVQPLSSSTSSSFEYQCSINHAMPHPVAERSEPERNLRNAQLALEQIRALRRSQEARRREQAEAKWIAANRAHYAGRWVALWGGDLIAAGDSAKAVAQAATSAPSTPLIIYLDDEMPFAGW
jgi:hypothetical protein